MKLTTSPVDQHQIVVSIDGRLDAETCNTLKQAFHDHAANGVQWVTVEMSQVTFIDSSGLSALISGLKTLRQAGGSLNLAAVGTQARTALRLTLLDTVLPIYGTVPEAIGALAPKT
jgi:anti-sigma B factor antagonist